MASRRTAFDAVLTPDSFAATFEGAATSGPSIQNHRGSKRGACDRCRGQKLRCLREDQSQDSPQAICVRCFKAGATCRFRTLKRTGRPRASHTHSHHGEKPKEGGKTSRLTVNKSSHDRILDSQAGGGQKRRGVGGRGSGQLLEENAAHQESEKETEDMRPEPALSPSSLHNTSDVLGGVDFDFPEFFESSSTATLPWHDEKMSPFYNDAGEASGLESFCPRYSQTFHTYQAQSMDIGMPYASPVSNDEHSRGAEVNACGTPTQTFSTNAQISGTSDEATDLDLPSENVYAAQLNSTKASNARSDKGRARVSTSIDTRSTAKPALLNDLTEKESGVNSDEEALSANEFQHQRMQELSELSMDLYAQLAANDPQDRQPTPGATATAFQDQLVGSVLKSSNTFLTLLKSFSASTAPFSPFSHRSPNTVSIDITNNSTCSSSDSSASPASSTLGQGDPAVDDEPAQHPHRKLLAGSSDDSKPPPSVDMATVLQLLTCYMHIIHLHSIMHARILDYMLAFLPHTTQHVDSVPPVFPGMQIGGVSLDKFGTFQVKLLLQISLHILGEIELALGLPKEYSVGDRKGDGRGVLESCVSGAFVKCLMREEAWRGKRVECVRERLENLRRVLKGAVDL